MEDRGLHHIDKGPTTIDHQQCPAQGIGNLLGCLVWRPSYDQRSNKLQELLVYMIVFDTTKLLIRLKSRVRFLSAVGLYSDGIMCFMS